MTTSIDDSTKSHSEEINAPGLQEKPPSSFGRPLEGEQGATELPSNQC